MGERCNAISEITRFWLQARHGCLIYESLPVPVRYNQSDIDFLAIQGGLRQIRLPGGRVAGPRLIVETKDEHDWEPMGKEFAQLMLSDIGKMKESSFIPKGTACKFSMLREEHFQAACNFFDSGDFDRVFIVHAMQTDALAPFESFLIERKIAIFSIRSIAEDLVVWYQKHPRPSGLRHTLTGDIWHLLVGFCGFSPSRCEK